MQVIYCPYSLGSCKDILHCSESRSLVHILLMQKCFVLHVSSTLAGAHDPEPLSPILTLGVNPFPYLIIFSTLRDLGFPAHFLEWPIRAKLLTGHAPE